MAPTDARPSGSPLQRLLSAQEVADYLGVPITTVYTWRHRSQGPPGFRVGRHLRYRRRDVEAWIERQLQKPVQ